jgi:hypothetical protein
VKIAIVDNKTVIQEDDIHVVLKATKEEVENDIQKYQKIIDNIKGEK